MVHMAVWFGLTRWSRRTVNAAGCGCLANRAASIEFARQASHPTFHSAIMTVPDSTDPDRTEIHAQPR